jgi:hypothetical protein
VESWEEEKGMETILPPKIIQDSEGISIQREMKKMDTQSHKNTLKEEIL